MTRAPKAEHSSAGMGLGGWVEGASSCGSKRSLDLDSIDFSAMPQARSRQSRP
ncbi:MAG: hypothetical protein ACFB0G_19660 [Leptolyngbyaceae cyanobacterium]